MGDNRGPDVRVLINNDGALQAGVAGAFQEYNTEQFTPVDVPGQSYKVRFGDGTGPDRTVC